MATIAGISNDTVEKKTGKGWEAWLQLLDDQDASRWQHKQIAIYLHEHHGLDDWWAQAVTVGYEQARGLREKHQKPDGYEISVSKTFQAQLDKLYQAWTEVAVRQHWLSDLGITISRATPHKSLRAALPDQTRLSVQFYPQSNGKVQITVHHMKLADSQDAEASKAFWKRALERLKTHCES